MPINQKWRKKYSSLNEFYEKEYDSQYFQFDELEKQIDPLETLDDLENYPRRKQISELGKCADSFGYFFNKYHNRHHGKVLYRYQKRVIEEFANNRFCLLNKFRNSGLTTLTSVYMMWICLFESKKNVVMLSPRDVESSALSDSMQISLGLLPSWLRPNIVKKGIDLYFQESNSWMHLHVPKIGIGKRIDYLILDEAAFIKDMEKYWRAYFPCLSQEGKCFAVSTTNGVGNWYYDIFHHAQEKMNDFRIIEANYWEHPEYDSQEWVEKMKQNLGTEGFQQEVLTNFFIGGSNAV